ncbi:MAG: hypothetical protein V1749_08500 [Candidatus Desantisbacteria bacterium]
MPNEIIPSGHEIPTECPLGHEIVSPFFYRGGGGGGFILVSQQLLIVGRQ